MRTRLRVRGGPWSPGGTILPEVSHGNRQSQGAYGGRWAECARYAHKRTGALIRPCQYQDYSEVVIADNHVMPVASTVLCMCTGLCLVLPAKKIFSRFVNLHRNVS